MPERRAAGRLKPASHAFRRLPIPSMGVQASASTSGITMSQTPAFAHDASRTPSAPPAGAARSAETDERRPVSMPDQERWLRVKQRLQTQVGEEVFKSWFVAMEHDGIDGETVRLSVPTRFLKSWVQSHYAEKLLACWQAEHAPVRRIELVVRSAVLRNTAAKAKVSEPIEP